MAQSKRLDDLFKSKQVHIKIAQNAEQIKKVNLIGIMVREGTIRFVRINKSIFQKDDKERSKILNIKKAHRKMLLNAGYDPDKVLNKNMVRIL